MKDVMASIFTTCSPVGLVSRTPTGKFMWTCPLGKNPGAVALLRSAARVVRIMLEGQPLAGIGPEHFDADDAARPVGIDSCQGEVVRTSTFLKTEIDVAGFRAR